MVHVAMHAGFCDLCEFKHMYEKHCKINTMTKVVQAGDKGAKTCVAQGGVL